MKSKTIITDQKETIIFLEHQEHTQLENLKSQIESTKHSYQEQHTQKEHDLQQTIHFLEHELKNIKGEHS